MEEILNENHSYDIPQEVIDHEIKYLVEKLEAKPGFNPKVKFDPKTHINFAVAGAKYRFSDLGIEKTHVSPINDIAVVEPFKLFTEDAINMMKWEIFSNHSLLKRHGRLNNSNNSKNANKLDFHISGFIDDTVFTKQAIQSQELKDIINIVMEDQLIIPHQFSMSHVNVSLARTTGEEQTPEDYQEMLTKQDQAIDNITAGVNWHYDSPPLVCVMMLSAPENMIGGETGVKLGDDKTILRVPNAKVGYGTMLQGRVIKHIATKPVNNCERISYVMSFIPEDPNRYDSTCATSERPGVSSAFTNDRFYPLFLNYRFNRVEQRLKQFRAQLMQNYDQNHKFDQLQTVGFIRDIESYLHVTYQDFEAVENKTYPPELFSTPYRDL